MTEPRTEFTEKDINEALDGVEEFIEETLSVLGAGEDCEVDMRFDNGRIRCVIDGDRDDVALIIGKRGQTLDAIQYLANAVSISTLDVHIPIDIDAEGYRERRATQLEKIADNAVADVLQSGHRVALDAMTAAERKVVHLYLKDHPEVRTESDGREPNRHLVVYPASD